VYNSFSNRHTRLGLTLLCVWVTGCDSFKEGNIEAPAIEARALTSGTRFQDPLETGGHGPEMIVIPAGHYLMGQAPNLDFNHKSLPVHEVTIAKPFAVSTHEVTNAQYVRFLNAKGHRGPNPKDYDWVFEETLGQYSKIVEREVQGFLGFTYHYVYEIAEGLNNDRRPVIEVSWYGALAYADWLSEQTGHHYRLPTEAEWEYATKAGTSTWYWWGDEEGPGKAVCGSCGSRWDDRPWDQKDTAPVGSFEPNPFGLYDVHGNAWEWVQDCWHPNYEGAPVDGSAWLTEDNGECDLRVLRGGGITASTAHMESAYRTLRNHPGTTIGGIRLARDL
jgi:formylglycine-generating enzyme required for sulfatase activity